MANTGDELRRSVYALYSIAIKCNLKVSVNKTKSITMKVKVYVRINIVISNHII
jgi:hypothetical protein